LKLSKKQAKAERKAERARGWKIDVRNYKVKVADFDENTGRVKTKGGRPVMVDDEFDMQGSLCDILFNRELQNKPEDAFKAHDLAEKIRAASKFVILDNEEMNMLRKAYDKLTGVTENMIEFCRRIRDAEKVGLKEAESEVDD